MISKNAGISPKLTAFGNLLQGPTGQKKTLPKSGLSLQSGKSKDAKEEDLSNNHNSPIGVGIGD